MLEKLKQIVSNVAPQTDLTTITESTRLTEDLGLTSIDFLVLMMEIEQEYGFEFNGTESFSTVGEVMSYIQERTA